MLVKEKKQQIVAQLKDDLSKANAVILTNVIGMKSNDSVAMRKLLRDKGGRLAVARNTLFRRAAVGTPLENLLSKLQGPHALAFSFDDAAAIAKEVYEAKKKSDHVTIEGGILDGKELSPEQVEELAKLPGREQMLSQVLATFNAPVSAFARVMEEIRKQKEGEA